LLFSFVGFGEESLFRGFLYPSLSSWLTPWGGAIVSSALFSVAHVGATSEANTFRFVLGLIFCWQYSHNNYDLGGNIFAHSWYDQLLVSSLDVDPFKRSSDSSAFDFKNEPIGLKISYSF
jgi:membrane protease YdiL (CAAX protease family)